MTTPIFDTFALVTLLILAVFEPMIGTWSFQRLLRWVEEGRTDARTRTYNWVLYNQWGLVLGLSCWWAIMGRGLAPLGLVPTASGWQWLAIGIGLVAVVLQLWNMFRVVGNTDQLAETRKQAGDLCGLSPQNPTEDRRWVLVSITAGVCEEFVYRGVLLGVLIPAIGLWPAVGLSSLIFGLGHVYQGLAGVLKTGLIGLVFAILTVYSGSLFVAILLHAVVDITSGRIMSAALRATPPSAEPDVQAV